MNKDSNFGIMIYLNLLIIILLSILLYTENNFFNGLKILLGLLGYITSLETFSIMLNQRKGIKSLLNTLPSHEAEKINYKLAVSANMTKTIMLTSISIGTISFFYFFREFLNSTRQEATPQLIFAFLISIFLTLIYGLIVYRSNTTKAKKS